jgi:Capsule polysaccharide biosynthesis protein
MASRVQLNRLGEKAIKGVHLGLRQVAQAPEQRAARRLRESIGQLPAPTGPRVAILSMRDWSVHVSWEATIGQALKVRGADVQFITCGGGLERCDRTTTWEAPPMPCHSCSKYVGDTLSAHGMMQHPLGAHWGDDDGSWPELDEIPSSELALVEVDGYPLGRMVDIPVKWFLLTTRVAEDPIGATTTRAFLRSARRVLHATIKTIDEIQPTKVVLVNGLFMFESIAREVCDRRGIDVVNYERGFITDTLLFARERIACFGELGDEFLKHRDIPLSEAERLRLNSYLEDRMHGRRSIERYWSDVRFDAVPRQSTGRRVSLFTNLTWDSAVIGKEIAFPSIQEWIDATIEYFGGHPDDELVIRIHPAEVRLAGKVTREPLYEYLIERPEGIPPNVRIIGPDDPTSSYPLMEDSDLVCVFTSTTGLEAALLGTPVIVAGETHYRGKGFTEDVDDPEQYIDALTRVLEAPEKYVPDADLVERYANLFFFGAPISSSFVREHIQGIAQLEITDRADLAPGGHPGLDQICDMILGT